jgi:agmatinase
MAETTNFGALGEEYCRSEEARIVIVPVPYDKTSTWLKGAEKGPAAIIEASANMELYDIETDSEVYLQGIFTDQAIEGESFVERIIEAVAERVTAYISKGKFVVVIGGEHSVSIGATRAHVEKCSKLGVLQLDAHLDLRDEYNGSRYSHACVMARARELCPIVQVGIRSMDASEKPFIDGGNVFFAKDIFGDTGWVEKVAARLPEKVYVTIDLDVFDPSIMSSTGTPEPGGLLWHDVLGLLREVFESKEVVGFDVVELCPDERNKAPDFLAAKLIYKLLSYKFR